MIIMARQILREGLPILNRKLAALSATIAHPDMKIIMQHLRDHIKRKLPAPGPEATAPPIEGKETIIITAVILDLPIVEVAERVALGPGRTEMQAVIEDLLMKIETTKTVASIMTEVEIVLTSITRAVEIIIITPIEIEVAVTDPSKDNAADLTAEIDIHLPTAEIIKAATRPQITIETITTDTKITGKDINPVMI
jgi:hypothetical protein